MTDLFDYEAPVKLTTSIPMEVDDTPVMPKQTSLSDEVWAAIESLSPKVILFWITMMALGVMLGTVIA